jgi:hypothetical protein
MHLKLPLAISHAQSFEPSLKTPQYASGQLTTAVHTVLLSIFTGQAGFGALPPAPAVDAPPPPAFAPPLAVPPAPPAFTPPLAVPAVAPPLLVPALLLPLPPPPLLLPATVLPVPAMGPRLPPVPAVVLPVPAVVLPPSSGDDSLLQPGAASVTKGKNTLRVTIESRFMNLS